MNKANEPKSSDVFFLSLIVGGRKHLLTNEACAKTVLDSLAWLQRTGQIALYGFVLLPSCLHLLCRPLRRGIRPLAESFAVFTAARMVGILRRKRRGPLMHYLHGKAPGGVWGEVRIRAAADLRDARRALAYMHGKPASAEWGLAASPGEYLYSSACFYEGIREPVLPVEDVRKAFAV